MRIGIVGLPGCGKSTVFGALTGLEVETGYQSGADTENIGVVKVPDSRVDALATLFEPKKTTYAETVFSDVKGGHGTGFDRGTLNAMRNVDALCQVVRGFDHESGQAPNPLADVRELAGETILADLELVEQRLARLQKERGEAIEIDLFQRLLSQLEDEHPLRELVLEEAEEKTLSGYSFLSLKPLLLVMNVAEEDAAKPPPAELQVEADAHGLGLVVLCASAEMDIAQMSIEDRQEFLESLGLVEPASERFIRAAYALLDLVSMLTAGEDECRAWPVRRGSAAPRAAAKIHSDIERGFIRAEVIRWEDLVELGSEARCKEVGKLRVEGKNYIIQDGDVVNFRFNV